MERQAKRRSTDLLQEERREVIEAARQAFADRPWDQTTQAACAYLLRHSLQASGNQFACESFRSAA